MKDSDCVRFLQWALPHLRMRWHGFRKVRKQVCKRVQRRIAELGLDGVEAYRAHLETRRDEWGVLDQLCRVTISRFYRDKQLFQFLEREVLPQLAQQVREAGRHAVTMWSAGCASGEEPYTLALVWHFGVGPAAAGIDATILATDSDPRMLARAAAALYPAGSLKDLPDDWKSRAFEKVGGGFRLLSEFTARVEYRCHDLRQAAPPGRFDLVLCRNLAFTYWDHDLQLEVGSRLRGALRAGGALVIGAHESLPGEAEGLTPWHEPCRVYRRAH